MSAIGSKGCVPLITHYNEVMVVREMIIIKLASCTHIDTHPRYIRTWYDSQHAYHYHEIYPTKSSGQNCLCSANCGKIFFFAIHAIDLGADMQTHNSTNPSEINTAIVVHCLETIVCLISVEN